MLSRDRSGLAQWLMGLARQGLGEAAWILEPPVAATSGAAFIREFADEAGDRRPLDALLLAEVMGIDAPAELLGACCDRAADDPALSLWLAVVTHANPDVSNAGPLFPLLRDRGLESWTEAELSGLHALSFLGPAHAPRVHSAAQWLVAEIQPDNGTNRPWAAHVFFNWWLENANEPAGLYAQTLVHNCRVTRGVPDRLSSIILASCAQALQRD